MEKQDVRLTPPDAAEQYSDLSTAELISRCCDGSVVAWKEFLTRYNRLVSSVVLKTCMRWHDYARETVEDLIQETYLRLCSNSCQVLRDFSSREGRDVFPAYLKVIAANIATDHFRARHAQRRAESKLVDGLELDEMAANSGSERPERHLILREIEDTLARLPQSATAARDRSIFKLHYRMGMTAKAIGELPAISMDVKAVESVLYRTTQFLRQELVVKEPKRRTARSSLD